MKYETEILAAFSRIGFEPRAGQVDAVSKVLVQFIDNAKLNVVLSAPTGVGKSILAVVIPEALSMIVGNEDELKSVVAMHQNSLVDQYYNTYKDNKNVIQIKGASNYNCEVMNDNAENCVVGSMGANTEKCDRCDFKKLKGRRNSIPHLITNFSFAFVDRMVADILEPRLCYVWDEAHTLNEVFTEHNSIYISEKRFQYFLKDIEGHAISRIAPSILKLQVMLKAGKVNDNNYLDYVKELNSLYGQAKEFFDVEMLQAMKSRDSFKYKSFGKLSKKYGNFACKISDLVSYDYPHVFEINDLKEMSIKAIFIGKMFDVIRNSKYNLFMSATVGPEFINTTMHLNPSETAFIKLDPVFPKEAKEVVFVEPLLSLNYASMKDPKVLNKLKSAVVKLIKFHSDHNESGIVLTPSYIVSEMISTELRKHKINTKIFEHVRGEPITKFVEAFKNHKGNAVLISPSIFEGIDLDGDCSRFQIITKVPWPSLGEKRMKFIADNHKKVYTALTLHKLIQGLGRSVRSETDYATMYILDAHGQRLFNDPLNVWAEEFEVKSVEMK